MRCEGVKVFDCSWPERGCVHAQQKQGHRRLKRLGQTWGTGHVQSVCVCAVAGGRAGLVLYRGLAEERRGLDWPGASGRDRDAFGDVGADGGRAFAGGGVGRMLSRWRALQGLAQDSEWPVPRFLQKPNAQKRAFFGGPSACAGGSGRFADRIFCRSGPTNAALDRVCAKQEPCASSKTADARAGSIVYISTSSTNTNSAHDTPSSAPPALTRPSIPHATPLHCRCHALLFFHLQQPMEKIPHGAFRLAADGQAPAHATLRPEPQ